MKPIRLTVSVAATLLVLSVGNQLALLAAEESSPPARRPIREELREQLKNLSPEEREAKIREFRERRGLGPNREEMENLREELKNLPPRERAAKIREWREKQMNDRPGLKLMTAEDRQAKRKEIRARLDKQLADLRKMKEDGTLTAEERNRLDRMEEVAKRFEQSGDAGPELRPLPPKATGEGLAKPPTDRNRNP